MDLYDRDFPADLHQKALETGIIAIDTETTGLSFTNDMLKVVQIYIPDNGVHILHKFGDRPKVLIKLLEDPRIKKIFHHGIFDLRFIGMRWKNVVPNYVVDTRIAAIILQKQKTGYADLVEYYFGEKLPKELRNKPEWDNLTPEKLQYIANDVLYLPALLLNLTHELKRQGKLEHAITAWEYLPAMAWFDIQGLDVYGLKRDAENRLRANQR